MSPAPEVVVRRLIEADIAPIAAAFDKIGWDKPASQYERYLAEQLADERVVLVAYLGDEVAGYTTVVWRSPYPPFASDGIPEISDLNVFPHLRNRGIAARLLDEAEAVIATRSDVAGIGVGLAADYGAAQRIYVKRGFVPDGRGLTYDYEPVAYYAETRADDDLVLWFTKALQATP